MYVVSLSEYIKIRVLKYLILDLKFFRCQSIEFSRFTKRLILLKAK